MRHATSITSESGPAATHNVLTHKYLLYSEVGTREVVRVVTSVGNFVDCSN